MSYRKSEKEIIKTIINYGDEVKSLADVINESALLEKRGTAIVPSIMSPSTTNYIFLDKEEHEDNNALGYVRELVSLVIKLIHKRLIIPIPFHDTERIVIGKKNSKWDKPEQMMIDNGKEYVVFQSGGANIVNLNGEQLNWPVECSEQRLPISRVLNCWFSASLELKDLVKHIFKTEGQRHFNKQRCLTWISIAVAIAIGIAGFFLN